jgi:hypothetical protein
MTDHPITPPPELVYDWAKDRVRLNDPTPLPEYIAARAAQWGADQELEACRMEIIDGAGLFYIDETSDRVELAEDIWTARRPKPPIGGSTMTQDYNKPAVEYFSKPQDFDKPSPVFFRKQGNQWTPVDNTVPLEEEKQTSMTDLSPAAQAVLDANRSSHLTINNLAAALEALADQVIPKPNDWDRDKLSEKELQLLRFVRVEILAIAAELRDTDH